MLAYGDRMRRVRIEADELAAYWVDRIERLLRAAVRDAHLIPEAQRVDVEFGRSWPTTWPWPRRSLPSPVSRSPTRRRAELTAYLAGNPRDKEGRVVYDLRGDFGLEPDELYERFAFYFDAFPQITQGGGLTVPGIHRERPGADAIARAPGRAGRRPR